MSDLDPDRLPTQEEILDAVRAVVQRNREGSHYLVRNRGASANDVAHQLHLRGSQRHGRGAVKGSWSGRMSEALRVAPTLRAMARAGKLEEFYNLHVHRAEYWLANDRFFQRPA